MMSIIPLPGSGRVKNVLIVVLMCGKNVDV